MQRLAPGSGRLFPRSATVSQTAPIDPHVVIRLLEDGDRDDLRALTGVVGEAGIVAVFAARGGRQLSRRSRAFWRLLLDLEPAPPHPAAEEIWPL